MKIAVVLFVVVALAASSQAFYYSPYFNIATGLNLVCHPQRCQACKDSFEEPLATYDCAGKCGLCALCEGSPNNVADCTRWCQVGEAACTDNCNKGKNICIGCAGACGL